jgi:hypothetical protein
MGYLRGQFDQFCSDLFGVEAGVGTAALTAGDDSWSVRTGEALLIGGARANGSGCGHRAGVGWVGRASCPVWPPPGPAASSWSSFRRSWSSSVNNSRVRLSTRMARRPPTPPENLRRLIRAGGDFSRSRRCAATAEKERLYARILTEFESYPRPVTAEFQLLYGARLRIVGALDRGALAERQHILYIAHEELPDVGDRTAHRGAAGQAGRVAAHPGTNGAWQSGPPNVASPDRPNSRGLRPRAGRRRRRRPAHGGRHPGDWPPPAPAGPPGTRFWADW